MYDLSIEGDNLRVQCDSGLVRVELIEMGVNVAPVKWTVFAGAVETFSISKYKFDRVHLSHNFKGLRVFDIVDGQLIELDAYQNSSFALPFVCVTGHSGGGTSIVAKSFIHLGMNLGADCGNFSNRKAFEAVTMRFFIDHILTRDDDPYVNSVFAKALASYKYDYDKINCFKITDLEKKTGLANGIGLSKLFKDIKFISVVKKAKGSGASSEGAKFNEASELDVYKQQHPKVQAPIFHLDWNRYFTDYTYVNEVLEFMGSDLRLTLGDFHEMLESISFDTRLLS